MFSSLPDNTFLFCERAVMTPCFGAA